MKRKLVVPEAISEVIGSFGLSRLVLIQLLTRIHTDFQSHAAEFQPMRSAIERCFVYRTTIQDGTAKHVFQFFIDDATSAEHYIIENVQHFRNG